MLTQLSVEHTQTIKILQNKVEEMGRAEQLLRRQLSSKETEIKKGRAAVKVSDFISKKENPASEEARQRCGKLEAQCQEQERTIAEQAEEINCLRTVNQQVMAALKASEDDLMGARLAIRQSVLPESHGSARKPTAPLTARSANVMRHEKGSNAGGRKVPTSPDGAQSFRSLRSAQSCKSSAPSHRSQSSDRKAATPRAHSLRAADLTPFRSSRKIALGVEDDALSMASSAHGRVPYTENPMDPRNRSRSTERTSPGDVMLAERMIQALNSPSRR